MERKDQSADLTSLASAIELYARDAFALDANSSIDHDEEFIVEGAFHLAGETLDSMDLVEFLTTLEDELQVDILGVDDLDEIGSLNRLASLILTHASAPQLASFCAKNSVAATGRQP